MNRLCQLEVEQNVLTSIHNGRGFNLSRVAEVSSPVTGFEEVTYFLRVVHNLNHLNFVLKCARAAQELSFDTKRDICGRW